MEPEMMTARLIGTVFEFEGQYFLEQELEDGLIRTIPITRIEFDEKGTTHYKLEPVPVEIAEHRPCAHLHVVKDNDK